MSSPEKVAPGWQGLFYSGIRPISFLSPSAMPIRALRLFLISPSFLQFIQFLNRAVQTGQNKSKGGLNKHKDPACLIPVAIYREYRSEDRIKSCHLLLYYKATSLDIRQLIAEVIAQTAAGRANFKIDRHEDLIPLWLDLCA